MKSPRGLFSEVFLKLVTLSFLCLPLAACIEVRDENQPAEATPKVVGPSEPATKTTDLTQTPGPSPALKELVINQEMFLYKGNILNAEQMRELQFVKREVFDWTPREVNLSYDKITFTSEGVLFIYDNHLTLRAQELESVHGQIVTFPMGQTATDYNVGRNGGSVQLEIEKASGRLSVTLRGENGGRGLSGAAAPYRDYPIPYCDQLNGGPGGQGMPGGSSGVLNVQLAHMDLFKIDVSILPGAGGVGGFGGPSYDQYRGGQSGAQKCDRREGGFEALIPQRGPEGPQGPAGKKQASVIIRGQSREVISE